MRKAIVLGAHPASNIGGHIAESLGLDGWDVWTPTMDELNVRSSRDVEKLNRISDALVYAPGYCRPDWIWDQTFKTIQQQIDTTLTGALAAVAAFSRANRNRGRISRVLIIGSAAAVTPHRGQVAYNAAKAGLRIAVETLARELHDKGVLIFLLEPGAVSGTPYSEAAQLGARRMFPGQDVTHLAARGTFGRNLTPEDIAPFAARIVSGEFDWLAGHPIPYSGGPQ